MKNILFLTSNNLATNPRLYKEMEAALEFGFRVGLIMFRLGNWSDQKTEHLLQTLVQKYTPEQIKIGYIDATPTSKLHWLFWGILEKAAKLFNQWCSNNLTIASMASSKRSFQLLQKAKKQNLTKVDLINAHNLAALYPAYMLSKRNNIPFSFDVEDFHPGEHIAFDPNTEKNRRERIMKTLLPEAKIMSYASPLIGKYTLELIGGHSNHHLILNSFPQKEFVVQQPKTSPIPSSNPQIFKSSNRLKLVWFSQKISHGRGLEQLFNAIGHLNKEELKKFQITLIGNMDEDFMRNTITPVLNKIVHTEEFFTHIPPLDQKDLHKEIVTHDIGLALEFNATDLNRSLCLTNKIMAYLQAGLFVLATDTPAQKQFLSDYPDHGILCTQEELSLSEKIKVLCKQSESIKQDKINRLKVGEAIAWDTESQKLSTIWSNL